MQIGAIADVHANKPALDAVLEDMPDVDMIVCAGDMVGYYPWPVECLEEIRRRDIPCIQGNHDRAIATGNAGGFNAMARAGVTFARSALDQHDLEWLSELPTERTIADEQVRVVHGHPDDPDHYTYPAEFSAELLGEQSVLVLAHTHVQHSETFPGGIVVNPGSVGQPRDGDPRAAYAVIDLAAGTVAESRVAYDIDAVIEAVKTAGLPRRVGERLREGR